MVGFIAVCAAALVSFVPPPPDRAPEEMNVAIVVHNGVELLDFAGPGEVFSQGGFHVFTVAPSHDIITSQDFLKVTPEFSIADAPRIDVLVIPGGDTRVLTRDPAMMAWIKKTAVGSTVTMSVCTGAFTLADNGLLDGMKATTHFSAINRLRSDHPKITVLDNERFVDNGQLVTTAGISAGIDGALHVVSRLAGEDRAWSAARSMQYNWEPPTPESVDGKRRHEAMRAWVYRDYSAAASAYAAIVADHPDDLTALVRLGLAQVNSGAAEEGTANIAKAVERGKNDDATLIALARANLGAGRLPDAIKWYEKVLDSDYHDWGTSRYNLACAYALTGGRTDDAFKMLTGAVDEGFGNLSLFQTDTDLASLRADPRFAALEKRIKKGNR